MTIRAAGAVVWREAADGPRVAVIHRPRQNDWSLPKGKLEAGEDELATAVRETEEETGWAVEVGAELTTTAYEVAGEPKTVRYWAMRARHGAFAPTHEVDALEWLPLALARQRLTYERDVGVLDRFAQLWRERV